MNKIIILFISCYWLSACGQVAPTDEKKSWEGITFSLADFLTENNELDAKVNAIYASLDDTARVAQLIMPAMGKYGQTEDVIYKLVNRRLIGGVLLLNGTKTQMKSWVDSIGVLNAQIGALPYLFSADAEPSLFNRKITGSTPVKKANEITSIDEVNEVARIISKDLKEIGINYNFSPVVDMAKNATVGYRGFGSNPENIVPWSNAFVTTSQDLGVIATLKHFPGHGLVSGDTHKALQMIDGELKEVKNYPPTIQNGALSVMVGHLAVKNNPQFSTNGMPATTSKKIVTELLRDSLGFKGLIVTDAMNMGGVINVANSNVLAIAAGCDIVLMPLDAEKAHKEVLAKWKADKAFQQQAEASVKRIIRAKVCLGLKL